MGLVNVLLHQVATAFVDLRFLTNDFDALTTACGGWLHYVHVLEVLSLSIHLPSLIVFREYVSWCRYLILLTVRSSHTENVAC